MEKAWKEGIRRSWNRLPQLILSVIARGFDPISASPTGNLFLNLALNSRKGETFIMYFSLVIVRHYYPQTKPKTYLMFFF